MQSLGAILQVSMKKDLYIRVAWAKRGMKALPQCSQNHAGELIGGWKHGVPGL